jgi:DNA-directed RNA polymerase I subunit RPA49
MNEQRRALGEAFGSKRAKSAIQSQRSNQIDTKALESVASQIYDNIKASTANIPSQGTSYFNRGLTIAALIDESNADRPIPSIDLSASTPVGLYSLGAIISDAELAVIDAEAIYALPDEESRLAAIPYK